jgi:drug/metabolite transporter (DMT)-like permease
MEIYEPIEMKRKPIVNPIIAILFAILAVSTASIFIRFAQKDVTSLVIAAYRLTIATLVLTPFVFIRKQEEIKRIERKGFLFALLSGTFLALHFAFWITSLEFTTVASAAVLVSTVPLWVALLAPLTIDESITKSLLIGLALSLIGVVIIALSDVCILAGTKLVCPTINEFVSGRAFIGDVLAFFGALMGAGYVLIGRYLRPTLSVLSYVFIVYGMAAIVLIIGVVVSDNKFFGFPPSAYVWLILLALVPQLLGHSIYNWALGYLSAAYVSITLLGEPIGSTILAYFLLGEVPTLLKLFGALFIFIGIYKASQVEKKQIEMEFEVES